MLEKVEDVEFILIQRVVEFPGCACDLRREDQEQQYMRDVHLPGSHHQSFGRGEKIASAYNRTVDVAGEIA